MPRCSTRMPSGCGRPALSDGLPSQESHQTSPCEAAVAAPEQREEQVLVGIARRHLGRLADVVAGPGGVADEGVVFRVGGVVDRLDLLAVLGGALGIEEEGPGGVAGPLRIGIGADDARDLQAGVEHVLVRGSLGPESAADGRRVGRIDADLAGGRETAVDAVDGDALPATGRTAGTRGAPAPGLGFPAAVAADGVVATTARAQRPTNSRLLLRKKECIASSLG